MSKKSANLILGKALLFAGIQFSLGSIEMSPKFAVAHSTRDQETLDMAVKALRDYIIIGTVWSIGNCLVFSANYGAFGLIVSLLSNVAFMLWIVLSYIHTLKKVALKYGLNVPRLFN